MQKCQRIFQIPVAKNTFSRRKYPFNLKQSNYFTKSKITSEKDFPVKSALIHIKNNDLIVTLLHADHMSGFYTLRLHTPTAFKNITINYFELIEVLTA